MLASPVLAMTAGSVAVVAGGWAAVAAVAAATVLTMVVGLVLWRDTASFSRAVAAALLVGLAAATPWAVETQRWLQPGDVPCAGCIAQPGAIPPVGGLRLEMISVGSAAFSSTATQWWAVLSGAGQRPDTWAAACSVRQDRQSNERKRDVN
jgi:hypothetical protein